MEHEHINDKAAASLALRMILSCIELSPHGSAATLKGALAACRGCDRCWIELIKHLTAYAAVGWDAVDFDYLQTDEHDVRYLAVRQGRIAELVADELAAVLDGESA